MKERLQAAVKGLPPKRASAILASVNLPASKRRRSAVGDVSAGNQPTAPKRRRNADDEKTPAASKPRVGAWKTIIWLNSSLLAWSWH